MRTYNRKRIKHQLIEDVHDLCRLCLKKPETSVPIYNGQDNICASLALRIMICVGLEITRDECLPNMVCTDCHKELERYYSFRKKCEVTYQKLKSHALAVKESKENKSLSQSEQENCKEMDAIKDEAFAKENLKEELNEQSLAYEENNKVELDAKVLNSLVKNELNSGNVQEVQESHIEEKLPSMDDPKFEALLSTVLLQLGIVATVNDKWTLLDKSVRTLEIETGNGKYLVELMEEEEEIRQHLTHPETLKEINDNVVNQSKIDVKNCKEAAAEGPLGAEALRCGDCGKRFATRSVLARHRRVHSGERPHACRLCGRRFAQRAVMLRHELVHNETRPHQCLLCPKSFTQRGALTAHVRSHAPPQQRPLSLHRCPRCPKLFLYASGLSRHMRAHSGHVFACSACARPFRDKSSLLRHVRSARHPAP
ncbi:unnamed protein product, partial [Iphiclides podalirius]